MSLIQVQGQGGHGVDSLRQTSPGLTANLPSNNPFRNRAASPAPSPVTTTFNIPSTAPERPISRNPFFDQSDKKDATMVQVTQTSPERGPPAMTGRSSPRKPPLAGHAVELFDNLTLNDGPSSIGAPPKGMPPPYTDRPPRSENHPPKPTNGLSGHRPSRSQEDEKHRPHTGRRPQAPEQDIFADPPDARRPHRRPTRRNSDSSIASKQLSPEEEARRRHRKAREARHRERDNKGKPPTSRSGKPNRRIDVIDSLDVTSIHGIGMFHHDGPFDACNPHRNRKGSERAPMQAFAKDSANNTIGGSGPVHKEINFAQFHGRGDEGFTDFATSGAVKPPAESGIEFESYAGSSAPLRRGPGVRPGVDRTSSFNPTARFDPVHGEESLGLGTSTFLEGAPAARTAIQRRDSENDQIPGMGNGGGLGRKRSLAQKIRGISNSNRGGAFAGPAKVTSPNGFYERTTSPTGAGEVQSAGGMPKIKQTKNPFFNDYDDAYEKKGQKIQIAEQRRRNGSIGGGEEQINARARAMSSPKRAPTGGMLERRITNDGAFGNPAEPSGGGGFLSRVKSLKGGKRVRPERREY
ncbi:hypothetical protein HO133_000635 [Letharia lupina]|uniref:Pal1-domain-containing protein n=1 Tax=Letharia lupina TaxID=560253 RepID=A0A8H6FCB6_9LECA|nr:uncharacterized protein HO133_000635 [Letharia lupina]KAF6222589.1 hypothetical protein HO133_000635 [Letharia lupina]